MPRRVLIMGAAGRDFHNFNVVYRNDPETEVVAFTATQIPFIADRVYPPELAGPLYPQGIRIHLERELASLIRELGADDVVFAYSDVSHEYVMHRASQVLAAGANFVLLGPSATMLDATVPVVAVCAVRTGAGKSQTTRKVAEILRDAGKTPVVVRHPMPYGDLVAQRVQRFASFDDLEAANTTIEEREEYEHHVKAGTVVADPLRAGHETRYHPGEANLRMASVVVVNKVDSATPEQVEAVERSIASVNPNATVIRAASPLTVDRPEELAGKRVLVVEDGPTLTHGEMKYGAGVVAARRGGAEIVDPRPFADGSLQDVYRKYDVGPVLPAMGYSEQQLGEMQRTIDAADCDLVVIATPIDLRALVSISMPAVRVTYELQEVEGSPTIREVLAPVLDR